MSRDGMMAARTAEQAVTLARETAGQLGEVGAMLDATAEWADDALAGGAPAKWVALRLITAERLIAKAVRGDAAAI
jgi:hypothetical protein